MRLRKNEKLLPPVNPNVGIEVEYRMKLYALIEEMDNSVQYWLAASYKANEPAIMAMDATPAAGLQKAIDDLTKQWKKRFNKGSAALAEFFARRTYSNGDRVMRKILKDAGISVEFKMTAAMRDVMRATIAQNVGLIKSIPEQYLTQVQGAVMRSVQSGRDLGSLSKELQEQFGVTKRRAALIARNQNNMATASMTRVRQVEVGITEAVWLHSHGGKEPRPTHYANSGKRYNVAEGWFDPDPKVKRRIWPGELINCRCVPKAVVKGFS